MIKKLRKNILLLSIMSFFYTTALALDASPSFEHPDPIADLYVFGVGLGLGVGGAISWKYKETYTGKFTILHEGWFGADTYSGGADKIGHFYTDYVLLRIINKIYKNHGYDDHSSIFRSFVATTTIRSIMEIADGYTTFRFSPEDLIANIAGALTSSFLLKYPEIDKAFGLSWTYLPSQEKIDGQIDWFSIDNDYNGSIYHIDARLKGIRQLLHWSDQSIFDHYIVGLSYLTRGYNRIREYKQRLIGLTLGFNISETITDYSSSDSIWENTAPIFTYFKLPFSFGGISYDLDHHQYEYQFGLNYFY